MTECTGGAEVWTKPKALNELYKTQVDPRLNYEQALEMASGCCTPCCAVNKRVRLINLNAGATLAWWNWPISRSATRLR